MTVMTHVARMTAVTTKLLIHEKFAVKSLLNITRQMSNCIFCKIITGDAPGDILYQDDDIVVFKDIKPSSKFHFLAVPKEHILNVKSLTKDHVNLKKFVLFLNKVYKPCKPSLTLSQLFHLVSPSCIMKRKIDEAGSSKQRVLGLRSVGASNIIKLLSVNKLVETGKQVLLEKGGNVDDVRLGFHLPPFNSVSHLHLHVISPTFDMSLWNQWVFKPNTWWFSSVDQVLEKIGNSKL